MPYCISEVRHAEFPSEGAVATALASVGLSLTDLLTGFQNYVCPAAPQTRRGYQMDLADDLDSSVS